MFCVFVSPSFEHVNEREKEHEVWWIGSWKDLEGIGEGTKFDQNKWYAKDLNKE